MGSAALDLAHALDPALVFPAATGKQPDAWQAEVLRSDAQQVAMLCCRQSGKSAVASVLGLHTVLYQPGSLTLVLSPTERQSKWLFRRIVAGYRRLGEPVPPDVDNTLSLELANGAQLHALPANEAGIRGFEAVTLLLVDEASRVPDALYSAVRPMLAVSGGRIVLLSTPFGTRGFFHREFVHGGDDWHRTTVTADQVPRITPEFLAKERLSLGERDYEQEYNCRWLDPLGSVFTERSIAAARSESLAPLFGGDDPWDLDDG